jgi:hypothetical protein
LAQLAPLPELPPLPTGILNLKRCILATMAAAHNSSFSAIFAKDNGNFGDKSRIRFFTIFTIFTDSTVSRGSQCKLRQSFANTPEPRQQKTAHQPRTVFVLRLILST